MARRKPSGAEAPGNSRRESCGEAEAELPRTPPHLSKKILTFAKKIPNVSKFKSAIQALGRRFAALPPRIGIIALVLCALFYAASFLQMLLPITVATKSILWIILFGLAKTAQYTAVAILGKEGIRLILHKFHRR